ncbi:MAG: FmdB family zinc ribbon protein [Bacteroidota bacterium]
MPTYVYKREDGTTFEIQQRITADALETCPTTGQKVKRIITGSAGLIFKGEGFYLTDYARKGKSGGSESKGKAEGSTSESSSSSSEASSSSSSDSGSSSSSTKSSDD